VTGLRFWRYWGAIADGRQIIFRSEPSSDLLDHFATIGIVD
jgi:hypothetical protein